MALKFGELWGELRVDDARFDKDVKAAGDRGADRLGKAGEDGGDQFAKKAGDAVDSGTPKLTDQAGKSGDKAGSALANRMEAGADGMKEGLSSAMEGAGIPLEMGAAGVGLAAGLALAGALSRAMDNEAINDKLSAKLDLNPTESRHAGETAGRLWSSGFGEGMEDISTALDSVMSTTVDWGVGVGPDALDTMTTKAMTFGDVMGVEVPDAMMTAQVMVKNGLYPTASEALDGLTVGMQRMPTAMREELFPALDEYSTYLATLGMDGSQQLAFLAAASEGGSIQLDKAGDSMKELGIRATDLTDTGAQDALKIMGFNGHEVANAFLAGGTQADGMRRMLLGALNGIKDPASQAQVALALFGTPLEDMNKAKIPEFIQMLNGAQTGLGDTSGAVDKLGSAYDNNATTVENWKRDVGQKLTDVMAYVITNFPAGVQVISDTVSGIWGSVYDFTTNTYDTVVDNFQGMVDWVRSMPGRIGDAASGMWDGIKDSFKGAMNWVIDHWNGLSLTLPSVSTPFGDVGGWTIDTPNIPRFHSGGTLGGGMGQEQLFLGLGGETIRTVEQERQLQTTLTAMMQPGPTSGSKGGINFHGGINVGGSSASPDDIAQAIAWRFKTAGV